MLKQRRIAVFHPGASVGTAWSCSDGIASTLTRIGHHVTNYTHTEVDLDTLQTFDIIILSAVEWYHDKIVARYGAAWSTLRAHKIALYAETAERDDRSFGFADCLPLADKHYFPAIQDAEVYGGEWLPFGADTEIFKPSHLPKQFGAAFLGTIYPKRAEYIKSIACEIAHIQTVSDPDPFRSVQLLAQAYGAPRIFVNLPAYSRLLVTKVTEVLACGTMLITPEMDHPSAVGNMGTFENGKHLVYYKPDRPQDIGGLIAHYLTHDDERARIAAAGSAEVRQHHSLEQKLAKVLQDAP